VDKPIFLLLTLWTQLQAKIEDRARGAALVEYALILVLVSVVSMTVLALLGGEVSTVFSKVESCLTAANAGGGAPTC
jgi:Flp pilus assembly pilin Flp